MTAKKIQLHIPETPCGVTIVALAVHTVYSVISVIVVFIGVVVIVIKKCQFGRYLSAELTPIAQCLCTSLKANIYMKLAI